MPEERYDVLIVGAGVAGALIAHRLADTNFTVAMFDAGPEIHDRLALVREYATADTKGPGSPYEKIAAPSPNTEDDYLYAAGSKPFKSTYERVVGGSTWHWLGNTPRLLPADFRLRTVYGRGVDWPISYDDLERWYGQAEVELGVSGNHEQWNGLFGGHRSQEFPMSEIWPSYADLQVERALEGTSFEGTALRVLRTPQARNSRPFDGRPACAGNSSCVPLCPIQAKYDASVHLAKATSPERRQPAQLLAEHVVTRIVALADGEVTGVEWALLKDPEHRGFTGGRTIVVAAHAIESVRILGNSSTLRLSSSLGHNLMDHLNRFGSIRSKVPLYPFRGPPTTSGIDAFRDGDFRRHRAGFRLSLGNDGAGRSMPPESLVLELAEEGFFGTAFADELRRRAAGLMRISCSTEMLPSPANAVRLSSERDRWGVPRAELDFHPDEYTRSGYLYAEAVMKTIFQKLDSQAPTRFVDDPDQYTGAGHIMGTIAMGTLPSDSVVDATCRAHHHPNLFVAGSSLFPTSGTANPTLTVAALALRLADHLARWLERPTVAPGGNP